MVSEQKTKDVVKMLTRAGWYRDRTVGSHSTWKSADGSRSVTVPDGHKEISPGVYRKILKAMNQEEE